MTPMIKAQGGQVVLDIEDSVQDIFDPNKSSALKKKARENLLELTSVYKIQDVVPIRIRMNGLETSYFEDDLKTIAHIHNTICPVADIWLPKSDNLDYVRRARAAFDEMGCESIKFTAMLESEEGLKNLPEILDYKNDLGITKVHYGHYDFSLSAGHWPFIPQDHGEFWKIIDTILSVLKRYDMPYVHTPLGDLNNKNLFKSVEQELNKKGFGPGMGMTALNLNQTKFANATDGTILNLSLRSDYSESKLIEMAVQKKTAFENNRINKRSFSVKDDVFVTPHEYMGACNFLERNQSKMEAVN